MSSSRPKSGAVSRSAAPRRASFHHGNLREALIEATVDLVQEGGADKVTVREAARRAGVSSGAPFRHFPNKTALMTAVAEQGMRRFRAEIDETLKRLATADPMARFRAIGDAYFRWVMRNPTHFRVISDRTQIDFEGSEPLRRDNEQIRELMEELLRAAQQLGLIRVGDVPQVALAARALAYGLGRMWADGHFAQWDVGPKEVRKAIDAIFDLFLHGLAAAAAP
jgi:AcrR family transcriptional regulator